VTDRLLATLRDALGASYTIERELGGGGMSRVFAAIDTALARRVVIKVLPPERAGAVSAERFKREVQLAARLQHPHIVPLLAAGEVDGIPFYTMPMIEGESLRARIAREHELPVSGVMRILRDVADALTYAHAQAVVHRDIKPDNVLLTANHAVVMDFGIAKALAAARVDGRGESSEPTITQVGVALGTPAYMAPEQASADPNIDHRTDIHALGAVGYELLTGRPPFAGHSPQALLAAVISEEARPISDVRPSTPPALGALVMRCLEKRPADRPQSAAEVLRELETHATLTGSSAAAPPPAGGRRAALGLAAAVVLAATAFGVYRASRAPVAASASVITVMPFVPASPDTALARLGRDLVITVSTNLDGVGALRATDPFATLSRGAAGTMSAEAAASFVRHVGAGSFVMGSLLREADRVRVDFSLHTASGSQTLARGSVSAPLDSVSALSDSLTWSLLRQIWRRDQPPTPSVGGLTTKSIPALRAYLEGERARGDGRFGDAIAAFDRAIEADSTFWMAYLRNVSTRNWMFYPVDSALRRYRRHVDQLPDRERALIEAAATRGISGRIAAYRRVADRFPDSWNAFLGSGDLLFHNGGLLGLPLERARADLERVVTLNPRWTEAWQHLLYVAADAGAGADTILRIMHDLGYDSASAQQLGFRELQLYRLAERIAIDAKAIASPLADSAITGMKRGSATAVLAALTPSFATAWIGGVAAVPISSRALRAGLPERDAAGHRSALMWAWASRGAFDSALVAAEQHVLQSQSATSRLDVLRVAALADFTGAIEGEFERRFSGMSAAVAASPAIRAEAHWLRASLAALRKDTITLASSRSELRQAVSDSAGATSNAWLREIEAFAVALGGNQRAAADSLMAIEFELAESAAAGFTTAISRGAAARWLQAAGRSEDAERLMRWVGTYSPSRPLWAARIMMQPLVTLERARLAEARGDAVAAERFYQEFLRRFDRPMPAHKPLVAEAKTALLRLSRNRTGS